MHCVNLSALLISSRCYHCHKRMLLMAGLASSGGNQLFSVAECALLDMTFSCPGSAKGEHLKIFVVHIEAGTVDFFHLQCFASLIFHADTSGDNVFFRKDRIGQHNHKTKDRIFAGDFQRFNFLFRSKRRRKSGKRTFSFKNFIRSKENFTPHASLCVSHIQAALTVIPNSAGRILHREAIQK